MGELFIEVSSKARADGAPGNLRVTAWSEHGELPAAGQSLLGEAAASLIVGPAAPEEG